MLTFSVLIRLHVNHIMVLEDASKLGIRLIPPLIKRLQLFLTLSNLTVHAGVVKFAIERGLLHW